jgi:hypothetical protein
VTGRMRNTGGTSIATSFLPAGSKFASSRGILGLEARSTSGERCAALRGARHLFDTAGGCRQAHPSESVERIRPRYPGVHLRHDRRGSPARAGSVADPTIGGRTSRMPSRPEVEDGELEGVPTAARRQ